MDDLMDMIISDESPSQITDKIKEVLYAKSAERIDMIKPVIAADMFNNDEQDSSEEEE
tara:strand:- start:599 stop:772 length:174 start_codon:yes stop_codon:yes gene_type:complete